MGSHGTGGSKILRRRREAVGRERSEGIGRGARGREGIWKKVGVVVVAFSRSVGGVVGRVRNRGGTGGSNVLRRRERIRRGARGREGIGRRKVLLWILAIATRNVGVGVALAGSVVVVVRIDRKSTRLNSSHLARSRMPSSA